jgi:hypothetical protein
MSSWPEDELFRIVKAEGLHIAPLRKDGVTYVTPTWVWSVAVGGALYVRGYYGQNTRWYQAAVRQRVGRITAVGTTRDVTFEPVDGPVNDHVDDAYRVKYRDSPYLSPMIGAAARAATLKVMPREANA